jgi:hypothetical protein
MILCDYFVSSLPPKASHPSLPRTRVDGLGEQGVHERAEAAADSALGRQADLGSDQAPATYACWQAPVMANRAEG